MQKSPRQINIQLYNIKDCEVENRCLNSQDQLNQTQ